MLERIIEPTLVIDKRRCLANISRMAKKARDHSLTFRPHFKTHQSLEVGSWFREFGVEKIAVSSVSMAEYFLKGGWNDITIAFPFNPRESSRLNKLDSGASINITLENIPALEKSKASLKRPVGIFIKIDTGYGRTGIKYSDEQEIERLLNKITTQGIHTFKGFLIHAGHTYKCRSKSEVLKIHQQSLEKIKQLRENFINKFEGSIISYGDTPTCSLAGNFTGIDEIRPGNFVYYDLMQELIGSCSAENIAVAVACPVVAKHPGRNQVIIHGGAVHFSKEFIDINGKTIYGKGVIVNESGIGSLSESVIVSGISQEHGILTVTNQEEFNKINIGDLVFILPVHSCLTANLLRKIQVCHY